MKIIAVDKHDHYCKVTFLRDNEVVVKSVRLGNQLNDFIVDLRRLSREADRDISYKLHGDLMHCEDPSHNRPSIVAQAS